MKKPLFLFAAACCSILLLLSSCSKDDSKPKPDAEETVDNLDDYFLVTPDGVELQIFAGSILDPTGTVQINIEIKSIGSESDLPKPLPNGVNQIGDVIHCGPDNFVFVGHAQLYMPAPGAPSPEGLNVLWYNKTSNNWEVLMINDIDADEKRLGVSVLELGYFVVVQDDASTKWRRPKGGFLIEHGNPDPGYPWAPPSTVDYSYYLTIYSIDFEFQEDANRYQHIIGNAGQTTRRPPGYSMFRPRTVLSFLPLGEYEIILSRYKRGTPGNPAGGPFETYSLAYEAELDVYSETGSWNDFDIDSNDGWTNLGLPPSGGEWNPGRPHTWAPPSLPPDDDDDDSETGTVTDIDGNVYQTVIIGNQEWMAENLRVSKYNNGNAIPTDLSNTEWESTTNGAYAIYPHGSIDGLNSDEEVLEAYGALYNWYAVDDDRGLCPEGWSVPSHDDWTQLEQYICNALGNSDCETHFPYDNTTTDWGGTNEGNALKSCRQVDSPFEGCNTLEHPRWNSHSTHYGFDEFGFSALPGGYRWSGGSFGTLGAGGYWWSSTEYSSSHAGSRRMVLGTGTVGRTSSRKTDGFSLRCVRD